MHLSALDNVLIGAHLKMNDGLFAGILQIASLREREAQWRARELLGVCCAASPS
jgi:ABC-type branched-subunit amino acid transport system ATPase component